MNVTKKVLAILLSMVMFLCSLPISAFATSEEIATYQNEDKNKDTIEIGDYDYSCNYNVGDVIEFGTYKQSAIKNENGETIGFNVEPLRWRILKIENGKALLFTEEVIDNKYYNSTSATVNGYYGNNYAHSDIREWLINDFYNTAFSSAEKTCIVATTLDNSAAPTSYNASGSYTKYSSESTTDKVFLLSKDEANTYASKYFRTTATDYAISLGYQLYSGAGSVVGDNWTLRTAGNNTYQIYTVHVRWGEHVTYFNWYDDTITTPRGVRPAIYVDLENYDETHHFVEQYPSGYDFFEDSYNFTNYGESISKKYFTTIYEDGPGTLLYKTKKDVSKGGLCFGMAYTTAAIYNGFPNCDIIATLDNNIFEYKYCDNIRDIVNYNLGFPFSDVCSAFVVGEHTITVEDYIKYAFIYQWSSEVAKSTDQTWGDIQGLYNAVKAFTDNNMIGVTIGMTHIELDSDGNPILNSQGDYITSGHRVLAVGYDGKDILIDDPNNKESLERLTINDDWTWSYSGAWTDDGVNSINSITRYQVDYYRPYQILLTGNATTSDLVSNKTQSKLETYIEGVSKLDTDSMLVYLNCNDSISLPNNAIKIACDDALLIDEFTNIGSLYWVENSNQLNISEITGTNNEIFVSGDDKIFAVNVDSALNFKATINEDNTDIRFIGNSGDDCSISLTVVSDGNEIELEVSGEIEDVVCIREIENGVEINGLSNGTVKLLNNDSTIKEMVFIDNDNNFNVLYDEDNLEVLSDVIEHAPLGDWMNDEIYHWQICSICQSEVEKVEHDFESWVTVDETMHKRICECGYEESIAHVWNDGEITKQPTHTDLGEIIFTCNDCGATKSEQIEKTSDHTYENWVKVDDTTHKHICECGEYEPENHIFGDWVITKEATESEVGSKEKSCVCGYTMTEEIPQKVVETKPSDSSTESGDSNESESSDTIDGNNDVGILDLLENIPQETIIIVGASIGIIFLVVICVIVKKKRR